MQKCPVFPVCCYLMSPLLSVLIASLSVKVCGSLLDSSEPDGVWQFCSWFRLRQPQTQSNPVEVRTLPLFIRVKLRERGHSVSIQQRNWPLVTQRTSLRRGCWPSCSTPTPPPPPPHTAFVWSPHVITVSVLCTQSLGFSRGPQSTASNRWPGPLFTCRLIHWDCLQLLSLPGHSWHRQ